MPSSWSMGTYISNLNHSCSLTTKADININPRKCASTVTIPCYHSPPVSSSKAHAFLSFKLTQIKISNNNWKHSSSMTTHFQDLIYSRHCARLGEFNKMNETETWPWHQSLDIYSLVGYHYILPPERDLTLDRRICWANWDVSEWEIKERFGGQVGMGQVAADKKTVPRSQRK